jgi:hypothetical protein
LFPRKKIQEKFMKRTLSTLSILTLGLAMSAFAYSQTPTATCCQGQAACCDQSTCCDHAKCCGKATCCQKTPKPACCDGKNSPNPAGPSKQ